MIKNNVKVKDRLSMDEKINATIYLTSSYFIDGEYTPYYRELSDIVVFFKYAVEGLEFEKQKLIHKTTPIEEKVLEILDKESQRLDLQMKFLEEADILQKKQIKQTEYNNKLAELMTPEETVEFSRMMVDKGFDSDEISKNLMEKFFAQKDYKNDELPIVEIK